MTGGADMNAAWLLPLGFVAGFIFGLWWNGNIGKPKS